MKRIYLNLVFELLLFHASCVFAQQPSPIGIIFNPRVNKFAVSGVGGGNFYELTSKNSSTSGQVAFDVNIGIKDGVTKRNSKNKYTTFTSVFKYNPLLKAKYLSGDSIEMRKIAFVDNEFALHLGFRFSKIKEVGIENDTKLVSMPFLDCSLTPYRLTKSVDSLNKGFYNFNVNLGWQFGFITNTDIGLFGVLFSPQVNFISIYDFNNGTSFEELNKSSVKLSNNLLGFGGKFSVPLNDLSIFFELRKYYPLDNTNHIFGLTDRAIISFGGVATGTVFKTKTKERKN